MGLSDQNNNNVITLERVEQEWSDRQFEGLKPAVLPAAAEVAALRRVLGEHAL